MKGYIFFNSLAVSEVFCLIVNGRVTLSCLFRSVMSVNGRIALPDSEVLR